MELRWVTLLNQRFAPVGNSRLQVSAAWVFRPTFQHHRPPVLDPVQQLQVRLEQTSGAAPSLVPSLLARRALRP